MVDLGGNSYHAIECLDIAEGTRVSNQKMSKEAQENMISVSQWDIVRTSKWCGNTYRMEELWISEWDDDDTRLKVF